MHKIFGQTTDWLCLIFLIRNSFGGRKNCLWMLELSLSVVLFCIIILSVDSFFIFLWLERLLNWLKLPFYSLFELKFCFRRSTLIGHSYASFPKSICKEKEGDWASHLCSSLYDLLALLIEWSFYPLICNWERVKVL